MAYVLSQGSGDWKLRSLWCRVASFSRLKGLFQVSALDLSMVSSHHLASVRVAESGLSVITKAAVVMV